MGLLNFIRKQQSKKAFQQAQKVAAQQHKQNLSRAAFFGSPTTITNMGRKTPGRIFTPSMSSGPAYGSIRGRRFNPGLSTTMFVDDISDLEFSVGPPSDPEYFMDEEVKPPDLAQYTKISPG